MQFNTDVVMYDNNYYNESDGEGAHTIIIKINTDPVIPEKKLRGGFVLGRQDIGT